VIISWQQHSILQKHPAGCCSPTSTSHRHRLSSVPLPLLSMRNLPSPLSLASALSLRSAGRPGPCATRERTRSASAGCFGVVACTACLVGYRV